MTKDNPDNNEQDQSENQPNGCTPDFDQNGTHEPQNNSEEAKIVSIAENDLEQIKKELAEFKDKYLRLLAETDNMRKRLLKEKQEMIQFSIQNIIAEFLHPLDHLENALKFTQDASSEVKHWALGFQMILTQFKDVLSNNNVSVIDSLGKAFDPHFHEAVEMMETEQYPAGTIVEEYIRGYKMGDRLIRAARVKVAKAPSLSKNEEQNEEINQQEPNNK